MQTYAQTFATSVTWEMNVPGRYFVLLACNNPVNVRFYLHGKKLDLGDISAVLAGLEAGPIPGYAGGGQDFEFDLVKIDVTGPDTIQIGIGNGQVHYNRSQGNVTVTSAVPPTAAPANTAKAVAVVTGALVAANPARKFLAVQNKDVAANIYLNFGAGAATVANGLKIPPGGYWEPVSGVIPLTAIQAIADQATGNIVVLEG